jgi:DNA repair protein RadC
MLTSRNKLIQLEHISNGGLVSSLVEQRAVFKKAIACNAAAIILIHNHPSGDSRPSDEDIRLTKMIQMKLRRLKPPDKKPPEHILFVVTVKMCVSEE